jgi:adenine-specific DNA-methyltransferase
MTVNLIEQNYINFLKTIEKESADYSAISNSSLKKELGQFFTDSSVAKYMSNLFDFNIPVDEKIELLDCGAGHGILAVALLYRLVLKGYIYINLTLYETDENVLETLEKNLTFFTKRYTKIKLSYKIIKKNFILDEHNKKFDYIISNPPYFKINKSDKEAQFMEHVVHGQPNIYVLFMAKSSELLKENGEMVFITPRSFTSGNYFKKFREYLLNTVSLTHIHTFQSRKKHFKNENILQETVISKYIKAKNSTLTITSSTESNFDNITILNLNRELIIEKNRMIIGIPTSKEKLKLLKTFTQAKISLKDMGYKISTGKVVTFRAKEFVEKERTLENYVPLLWMQNFKNEQVVFPLKSKKEQYIQHTKETENLLISNNNYLIIKRFSSKEQHRRVNIGYVFKNTFDGNYLGLENHLNYLYREDRDLEKQEMIELGLFLTSEEVDQYFRIFNGNTQVNATDILTLPVPISLYKGYKCQD